MPRTIETRFYVVEYRTTDEPVEDPTTEFSVRVILADILKAEEAGPTHGLTDPNRQSFAINTLWIWAAAVREGKVPAGTGFQEFRKRCIDWSKVAERPVFPTPEGASAPSLSGSPSTSPAPSTIEAGSTPADTTSD